MDTSVVMQSVQIQVPQSGLYRIPYSQLQSIGFQIANAREWRLSYRGMEIPFWFSNQSDSADLLFFAPPTQSQYVKDIYLILAPKTATFFDKDDSIFNSLKIHDLNNVFQKLAAPDNGFVMVPLILEEDAVFQPLAA
ncbi:MAG: hypothetical protein ACPL6F_01365, partial [Anaerolineales bacterium]